MNKWSDYLRAARDQLLAVDQKVYTEDVVELALSMPGGRDAFEGESEHQAYAKSLRDASKLLSKGGVANDDPSIAGLFDLTPFTPPRALTLPQDDGRVAHKGIEHATRVDCDAHTGVLEDNIRSAVAERQRFGAFVDDVLPVGTPAYYRVIDALMARVEQKAA